MRQLCVAIVVISSVLPVAAQSADASICPTGQQVIVLGDGSSQCAHDDTPPVSSTRAPEFYSAAAEARALSCFGDGEDGRRLQALYVTDGQSSLGTVEKSAIVLGMINAEVIYENSSLAVSDTRLLPRWVLTPDCEPSIQVVTVQPGALDDFGATIRAVAQLGFDRPDRKYIMWADSDRLCGIASVSLDDHKRNNANDGQQPGYARIDRPCWGYQGMVVAHEVTHTFGAVMPSAPHATSLGHCTDEHDIMCYEDAPGATMQTICPDEGGELLLDCNNDDYFHPDPPEGSWLHTHWNVADSSFLERIPPGGGAELRFADVGFGMPLGEAIEWLADRGITRGCGDTRFCPDDPVTRGQMAAFLHRFAGGERGLGRRLHRCRRRCRLCRRHRLADPLRRDPGVRYDVVLPGPGRHTRSDGSLHVPVVRWWRGRGGDVLRCAIGSCILRRDRLAGTGRCEQGLWKRQLLPGRSGDPRVRWRRSSIGFPR